RLPSLARNGKTGDAKECSHCHTRLTPRWRHHWKTRELLCNACGLQFNKKKQTRPSALFDVDTEDSEGDDSDGEYAGPKCSNCRTREGSIGSYRHNDSGGEICNACRVYKATNGTSRPKALWKYNIRKK
ncbi:hypothetical protein C8R44DRAFT_560452, partial [Mycena epipterygia]